MIGLYPDASEEVKFPLLCDATLHAANTPDAIDAYRRTNDHSPLTIPAGATWVTICPLDAPLVWRLSRACGDEPDGADADALEDWREMYARTACHYGLKWISIAPDVTPATVRGVETYPDSILRRIDVRIIGEIGGRILAMSKPSGPFARSSAPPSGSEPNTWGAGGVSTASGTPTPASPATPRSTNSAADAVVPSVPISSAPSAEPMAS